MKKSKQNLAPVSDKPPQSDEKNGLSAKNLKAVLWDTLCGLKSGKVEVGVADAIASQSREIVRVIKSQQSILMHASETITKELLNYAK